MTGWKRRWARLKQKDKVLSLIGLAMKAGRCTSGEMMTESETKSGRARLVIIAIRCIREYKEEISGYV